MCSIMCKYVKKNPILDHNNDVNLSLLNMILIVLLQHEPSRLSMEAEKLNHELESLVMENYRVFVENLTCSVHLRNEDKKLG